MEPEQHPEGFRDFDWPCEGDPFPGEVLAMAAWIFSADPEHIAAAYQRTLPDRQRTHFALLWQQAKRVRERRVPARAFRACCLASTLKTLRRVGADCLADFVTLLDAPAEVLAEWVDGFGDTPPQEVLCLTLMRSPDARDVRVAEYLLTRRPECREAS